jgi:hypothetical protein
MSDSLYDLNLYQERVLALNSEFNRLKKRVTRLSRPLAFSKGKDDLDRVKAQLALISTELRILKEEASFCIKLGELYDIVVLRDAIEDFIKCQDPETALKMKSKLEEAYKKRLEQAHEL